MENLARHTSRPENFKCQHRNPATGRLCPAVFGRKWNLQRHYAKRHKDATIPDQSTVFINYTPAAYQAAGGGAVAPRYLSQALHESDITNSILGGCPAVSVSGSAGSILGDPASDLITDKVGPDHSEGSVDEVAHPLNAFHYGV